MADAEKERERERARAKEREDQLMKQVQQLESDLERSVKPFVIETPLHSLTTSPTTEKIRTDETKCPN